MLLNTESLHLGCFPFLGLLKTLVRGCPGRLWEQEHTAVRRGVTSKLTLESSARTLVAFFFFALIGTEPSVFQKLF